MKNFIYLFLFNIVCFTASAQQTMPVIKQGTTINYTFHLHGQQVAFVISVKSMTDTLALNWTIRSLAGGTYKILPEAVANGNRLNFAQPTPFTTVKLAPNETFCIISKKAFKDLVNKHQFTYDNTVYDLKDDIEETPLLLDKQPLNVLHVGARNETTQLWILNNPNFPLICQIKGNPLGIDFDLLGIK